MLRLFPAILQRLLLLCNIQGGILFKQEGTQAAATSTATCIMVEQPGPEGMPQSIRQVYGPHGHVQLWHLLTCVCTCACTSTVLVAHVAK